MKEGDVDLDWWRGGDDARLVSAEFIRKKLKNELTISDIYPKHMNEPENIKAMKKGFWCTEEFRKPERRI